MSKSDPLSLKGTTTMLRGDLKPDLPVARGLYIIIKSRIGITGSFR
ncbi:MAG TPA: hypothetical protein VIM29_00045 [Bacillota bacterium]